MATGAKVRLWTGPGILKEICFSKIINTPLLRPQPDLHKCVTLMNFQKLLVFLLGGLAGGSPIENLTLIFCFKKSFFLKHHGDL